MATRCSAPSQCPLRALPIIVASGFRCRCAFCMRCARARPERRHRRADQGAVPTVSLLTFGPGDQAFAKFGHNALLVHDPSRPPESRDLVFNYGAYSFDSPLLVLDFLKGDLRYWLSVSTLSRTVAGYRAVNRSVFVKQLALTPAQAQEIAGLLHENAKPENRYYRYDYYRDNCSTRVRDLLDKTLGGALERASRTSTAYSYRDHTRRLTRDSPLLFFGLDLAMGPYIDHPITEWEAMFLPMEVDGKLTKLEIDHAGQRVPLVKNQGVLFSAIRPELPETMSVPIWPWLLGGLALGAGFYTLGRMRNRWGHLGFAASTGLVGFIAGAAGMLLIALWAFTDHRVTYWNQNILLCPVWALALPVFALDLGRTQPKCSRLSLRWFGATGLCALLALAIQVVSPSSQHNGPALALLAPCWIGAALGAWERLGRPLTAQLAARQRADSATS